MSTGCICQTLVNVNTARKAVALSRKAMRADADWLSGVIQLALRMSTAKYVLARMSAVISKVGRRAVALMVSTHGVAGTGVILIALDHLNTSDSGVSGSSRGAPAVVASWCVRAYRRDTALPVGSERLCAFVDVVAAYPAVAGVAGRTGTAETTERVGTKSSLTAKPAGTQQTLAFVDVFAETKRVPSEARGTGAAVAARCVGADCPLTAEARRAVVHVALVDIDATSPDVRWIECEAHVTYAGSFFPVGLANGVPTALHRVTGRDASFLGVSDQMVGTVASVAAVAVHAFGVLAARRNTHGAFVHVSTSALRRGMYLLVTCLALTKKTSFRVDTASVPSACASRKAFVSVDAFLLVRGHLVAFPALAEAADALGVGRAVVVSETLHPDDISFAGLVGITGVPLGTFAAVATRTVVTETSDGARILGALVHVETLNPWVSRVAFFAAAVVRSHVVEAESVEPASCGPRAFVQVLTTGGQVRIADVPQFASAEVASFRVRTICVGSTRMRALVDVLTGHFRVPGKAGRTLAVEESGSIHAGRLRTAGEVGVQALVHVHATFLEPARQGSVAGLALAVVASRRIVADRVGPAGVVSAFVHIVAFSVSVSRVSRGAVARVASRNVLTLCVGPARQRILAFVDIVAGDCGVSCEALFALADVVSRQVAALGVLHTQGSQRRNFAFVDVVTIEAVALVARKTGTVEAAHGVGAVRKHVARSVLALVLVWHLAAFAAVAVVAVTQVVQAGTVTTPRHLWMAVISIRALEVPGQLVGALEALRCAVAELRQLEELEHLRGLVHLAAEEAVF